MKLNINFQKLKKKQKIKINKSKKSKFVNESKNIFKKINDI